MKRWVDYCPVTEPLRTNQARWAVITTVGRVVVEAETPEGARVKVERKGYIVREVNRDNSDQPVSF